jgi:hypothetical protein
MPCEMRRCGGTVYALVSKTQEYTDASYKPPHPSQPIELRLLKEIGMDALRTFLNKLGYEMEVEQSPAYFPPFVWIFAAQGEKRIPICSTQSYFLKNGLASLPTLVERQIHTWE